MALLEAAHTSPRRCKFQNVELLKDKTLGIGSYGKVCKAKCDNLICAAKILHPTFFGTNDPGTRMFVEKFEQECEFLRFVTHPNIVQCLGMYHDADGSQRLPVLLLELMDESLTHFLDRSKEPLSYFTEVTLSHDVILALAYLHSNGYIHRDLSSNNILLIAGSRAKVADFGMCRLSDATAKMMTTCPGTLVYMPPEALREPPKYTDKLDTFSFGVVLVQIMARLFPNPGPSREVIDEVTERIVLETRRRDNHIKLVQPNHPLLRIALDCLMNTDSERPTASELCERFKTLKESSYFIQSKNAEQQLSFVFLQKKQRELRKEYTKASLVREQQVIEQLDETAMRRENELMEQIRALRLQLNERFTHRNSQQSEESLNLRPQLADSEFKSEVSSIHRKPSSGLDRQRWGSRENVFEKPGESDMTAESRDRIDSVEHESVEQWKVSLPPTEPSFQNLYEKWNIQPPALRAEEESTKTDRFSVTSQFIDFRSTSDDISGPSLDQVLSSRISEYSTAQTASRQPLSHLTSDNSVIRRGSSDDNLSDVKEYLKHKSTSDIEQHDYYNLPSLTMQKEHTYVNKNVQNTCTCTCKTLPIPKRNVLRSQYSNPDNNPASPKTNQEGVKTYPQVLDRTEYDNEAIEEASSVVCDGSELEYAYVRSDSPSLPPRKVSEHEYDYVDDDVVRSLTSRSLLPNKQNIHGYVNTGVSSSSEQPKYSPLYENDDFIARSEFASLPPTSITTQQKPRPKPRKLPPRNTLCQYHSVSTPTACNNNKNPALSVTLSLPTASSSYQDYRRAVTPTPSSVSPNSKETKMRSLSDPKDLVPPTDADFQWKCSQCSSLMHGNFSICKICGHNKDETSVVWYTYD